MSLRENIEIYGLGDSDEYIRILTEEYDATKHPGQADAFVLDNLPFYSPQWSGDHISILGFNNVPLPDSLVEALVSHPDIFPDNVVIRWTQEQELIVEAILGQLRERAQGYR